MARIITEDEVVDAVIGFLKPKGWEIESRATVRQHGYDIVAVRNAKRLIIEAKGAGSSQAHTRRFGQQFTRSQVFDHVAKAILKALQVVATGKARAAVAFPDNDDHREEVERVHAALKAVGIEIFWASADGKVTCDGTL
ncbi:MAG: hypothetical protein WB819_00750 [Terriglobia bacterium]|jgi:hypothetical protein